MDNNDDTVTTAESTHQRAGYEGCNKIRIFSISYFVYNTRITSTAPQIMYF
jgi:hypothetical protein